MHSHSSAAAKLIVFTVTVSVATLVTAECPVNCHCSRYKTLCDAARLYTLPTLPSTTQYIKIEVDNIPQINSSIITHSGLRNLTRLDLIKVNLQEIEPGAFQNMSQLEHLVITDNTIRVLKTNSFMYLQNLYFLDCSHNGIHSLESGTFSGLSKLRHLDFRNQIMYNLNSNIFEGIKTTGNCDLWQVPVIYQILLNFHSARKTEDGIMIPACLQSNDIPECKNVLNTAHTQVEPEALKYLCSFKYIAVDYDFRYYRYSHNQRDKENKRIPYHVSSGLSITQGDQYFTILYKRLDFLSTGLLYLDLSGTISQLTNGSFQNLKQLTYLDVSNGYITEIPRGSFEGLVSLKTLKLNNNNYISSLNTGAFIGLDSLKRLEISSCMINTIEHKAFQGLAKLQLLDLSGNRLHILKNNTFSGLHMLKLLKLDRMQIKTIENNAFSCLSNLKTFSNTHNFDFVINTFDKSLTTYDIEKFYNILNNWSKLQTFKTEKEVFLLFDRLDSLELTTHITFTGKIQVLKSLHLYIDGTSVDPQQELRDVLQTVHYVQELYLTLLQVHPREIVTTLAGFKISSLFLLNSNFKVLHNNSLIGWSTVKTLTIFDNSYSIQIGAFHEMTSLTRLLLFYTSNLTLGEHCFCGLHSLKQLSIVNITEYRVGTWYSEDSNKCLHKGTFVGLGNLKRLVLIKYGYACLNPGAFQGLHNIEQISLNNNYIQAINAGVFGAECKTEFTLSCKNVTLTEYCDSSNALTTLKYLDLAHNNITYIHPYAFIACNNLHTLDLSYNSFLTLDNPFLFTPGLRKFIMQVCDIGNIPNNTFECTPLLSHIDFSFNQRIKRLTLSTLLPLKQLKFINMEDIELPGDCKLHEIWLWMRQHHVHYILMNFIYLPPYKDLDVFFSTIQCNKTLPHTAARNNSVTVRTDDFELFKQYIEPLVLIVILISCVACNGFLIFVSLYHKDMRTKQNALVIHLAIVDVLSLIFHLPLSYWDTVNVIWEFDNIVCKIFILSKDMVVAVNVSSVVALCIERFLVAKTFKNLKKFCVSETIPTTWLIVMSWLCGILTSFPAYFFAAVVDGRCLYCPPSYENYVRNAWTYQLIMYCLVPAVAIAFLNIKTSIFLRESVRKIPGEIKNNIKAKNRKIVANVVLILAVVFLVSSLPSYVLRVLVAWSIVDMNKVLLPAFCTYCLFFCSTVFNPISLFIMSSKFKSYALRHFPFLGNQQNT